MSSLSDAIFVTQEVTMQGLLYISPQEILMGREIEYPLTPQMKDNLDKLLVAVNRLRVFYGKPLIVSSGYRPGTYNEAAKGAKNSSHLTCEAVDFRDKDQALARWLLSNPDMLIDCGLYMEDPQFTNGWVHLQVRKPPSGQYVFKPGGKARPTVLVSLKTNSEGQA